MAGRPLLVSVHDVMPETLTNTEQIVRQLGRHGLLPVTLLVVPDSGWDANTLRRLRDLVEQGADLAGHGWRHVVDNIRGLRHRLHSYTISRNAAEHMALSRPEIRSLLRRCHAWFAEHDLPAPELYVPPAWAMGDLHDDDLEALPFGQYETLRGVYDVRSQRFHRLAMLGFEADTAFRAASCRAWNKLNLLFAGPSKPIRIAIHPRDLHLKLAGDLSRVLVDGGDALTYRDIAWRFSDGG